MNEFRQDPITKQWVIISTGRDARPQQFRRTTDEAHSVIHREKSREHCPFCIHQMDTPPILARYGGSADHTWDVCVVPNLYPALDQHEGGILGPPSEGFLTCVPARGIHEVVIESPTHCEFTSELSEDQVVYMLHAYRDRLITMRDVPGVQYALAIKNSGRDAGASLRHTHSQILGLPLIPDRVEQELRGFHGYWDQHNRCVLCDMVRSERDDGSRVIAETADYMAWCPHASRFQYEFWLAPRSHQSCFEDLEDNALRALGRLLVHLFGKLDQSPRIDAFNCLLRSRPFDTDRQDHYHWHIEFLPRIAKQAGFEWGTGIHINTVDPALAAGELRID